MKAIIIDDEYYALQGLKMELEEICGVEVVGIYEDGKGALEEINVKNPDIVFLDIEMPAINGLELFRKLIEKNQYLKIVFTTAYNHYAVQAFELNAVDYLVKPVQKQRLLKTIERLKSEFESENIERRISIECFCHFSIISDKVEINNGWRTKKAEEVLGYLICEKGKFVSKEKISEALWPELDGEKSLSNLYLAYYYLKKQEKKLGVLFPIISERGKMCININEIDCDILSFDKYLKVCNKIDEKNIEKAEKAVELYKGRVFEDKYYTWTSDIQQYYENRYLDILEKIIDYYKKKGDVGKVKNFNRKLISI